MNKWKKHANKKIRYIKKYKSSIVRDEIFTFQFYIKNILEIISIISENLMTRIKKQIHEIGISSFQFIFVWGI